MNEGPAPTMKRNHQIFFICVFLFLIYLVPIVQTSYEFRTNKGHHIQMLDLVTDIFVTPLTKANDDAAMMDSVANLMRQAVTEISGAQAAPKDSSGGSWDAQVAADLYSNAGLKVKILKSSVIDYNRYLNNAKGDHNKFAKIDTLKPYYRALVALGKAIDSAQVSLPLAATAADFSPTAESVAAQAMALVKNFGGKKSFGDYIDLTLTALNRTMVGADYLRPYEKEMEESSVFVGALRPVMFMTYFTIYNDLGSKGVLGKNGWFFYRSDVDYLVKPSIYDERSKEVDANDAPITDDPVKIAVSFKEQLAAKGIDLLMVIMPTKPSIYPDMLNASMKPDPTCSFSHSIDMMARLSKAGVETVDLFSAFAKERQNDKAAGDSLYLHTDTHFKNRAVRLTAATVAARVKQYPWYQQGSTEYEADSIVVPRTGDIGDMTKLPQIVLHGLHFSFPAESTICRQVYQITRDENGAVADRTLYKEDYVCTKIYANSQILILGDSFSRMYQTDAPKGAGWISHLAKELSQPVASLVSDGGASTMVREELARKSNHLKNKKLVIWEVVERDFRYGAEGWKNVAIN
jgi:hypothetical protein